MGFGVRTLDVTSRPLSESAINQSNGIKPSLYISAPVILLHGCSGSRACPQLPLLTIRPTRRTSELDESRIRYTMRSNCSRSRALREEQLIDIVGAIALWHHDVHTGPLSPHDRGGLGEAWRGLERFAVPPSSMRTAFSLTLMPVEHSEILTPDNVDDAMTVGKLHRPRIRERTWIRYAE